MTLPKPLSEMFNGFSTFYKERFREKHLSIAHQYGSCLIQVNPAGVGKSGSAAAAGEAPRMYHVETNMAQAAILLLFNAPKGSGTLKLQTSSIVTKTNLPAALVSMILAQLASEDYAILKQAIGSTRKSMTDLSYEVSDDFDIASSRYVTLSSAKDAVPMLALPDVTLDWQSAEGNEGGAAGTAGGQAGG